jgi:hypothetical protein
LFGKNTTAGVLNISTRAPSFEPGAAFESTAGNDSYWQVRGAVTGPLTEHLAGRISVNKTYRDGYIDQPVRDNELNEANRLGARGQLLWQPNDALNVRFIADYNKEESDCCAGVIKSLGANDGAVYLAKIAATGATYQFDPDYETVWTNGWQHMSVEQGGSSVEANWKLGDSTLTSITAWRFWDFKPYNDADGVSLDAIVNAAQQVNDSSGARKSAGPRPPASRSNTSRASTGSTSRRTTNCSRSTDRMPASGSTAAIRRRLHRDQPGSAHPELFTVRAGDLERQRGLESHGRRARHRVNARTRWSTPRAHRAQPGHRRAAAGLLLGRPRAYG